MISMLPEALPITQDGTPYLLIGLDDREHDLRALVIDAEGELTVANFWPPLVSDWRFDAAKDAWVQLDSKPADIRTAEEMQDQNASEEAIWETQVWEAASDD